MTFHASLLCECVWVSWCRLCAVNACFVCQSERVWEKHTACCHQRVAMAAKLPTWIIDCSKMSQRPRRRTREIKRERERDERPERVSGPKQSKTNWIRMVRGIKSNAETHRKTHGRFTSNGLVSILPHLRWLQVCCLTWDGQVWFLAVTSSSLLQEALSVPLEAQHSASTWRPMREFKFVRFLLEWLWI